MSCEQIPDACLAVVGDGPERAALEHRFAGTDSQFLGYLKGEELAAAYASADAFVYASETETMGNVVLEAMACGCPVVAPSAGGIPNLVSHGTTGFLYQPRDLQSAVQLTKSLLADDNLRTRVGQPARQAIEERNWEQSVGRVREVYADAIRSKPSCTSHGLGDRVAQAPRRPWCQRFGRCRQSPMVRGNQPRTIGLEPRRKSKWLRRPRWFKTWAVLDCSDQTAQFFLSKRR